MLRTSPTPMLFRSNMLLLFWIVFALVVAASTDEIHQQHPNILLLITDDQDVLIGGTDHMPLLKELLQKRGTTFSNAFVHTPICCPSRSSILSGRYLHNGVALNNSVTGNCNGGLWQEGAEQETFAVFAQQAGYHTAYAGKYLNQYGTITSPGCPTGQEDGCKRVPPGWDRWMGLVGNSAYYGYRTVTSNDGGASARVQHHGSDFSQDYLPDLVANRTLEMISELSKMDAPFLITAAWPTPHAPFTPAPMDEGTFAGHRAHRTPNWNTTRQQNAEKHWMMRRLAMIDSETEQWIDHVYQLRSEALLSIDRHIQQFVDMLEDLGQLDNTFIIYTSDNGWQLGQHRIQSDKRQLYEHDIRVPLVVRGPGVAKGASVREAVLNIDLAPTITEIATGSLSVTMNMDGQSFLSLILQTDRRDDASSWRHDFLVSYHGEADPACGMWSCPPPPPSNYHGGDAFNNTYHCVRTIYPDEASPEATDIENSIYCRFEDDDDFVEYYNLETDPWQLHNAVDDLTLNEKFEKEARLIQLKRCQGASCRR